MQTKKQMNQTKQELRPLKEYNSSLEAYFLYKINIEYKKTHKIAHKLCVFFAGCKF